ncbi:MAG: hypothetical protein NVV60_01565 [Luteimonas sp.]|nr:hypothetical protein [Luteimonas sp.]
MTLEARAAHRAWMKRWNGNRRSFKTPCCGKRLTVPAPSDKRQQWDSLMTCPHCEVLLMKVVTTESAKGLLLS